MLEVGAGSGWTSRTILETYPQVELTAIDSNPDASQHFEHLREDYGRRLRVQEANVLRLPYDRDSFDFVVAFNIFRYLSHPGVRRALLEIIRVTRPGGYIGISEYSFLQDTGALRSTLNRVIQDEQCHIVHHSEGMYYDIWIQKKYPVEQDEHIP